MKIPSNVLKFAGQENLAPYQMFVDYYNHYRAINGSKNVEYQKYSFDDESGKEVELSFAEKEDKLNSALKREIMRVAGITNFEAFPVSTWQTHPTLRWATFAVVSAMIDMILPNVIVDTMGAFSEVRNIGLGDVALGSNLESNSRNLKSRFKEIKLNRLTMNRRRGLGIGSDIYQFKILYHLYRDWETDRKSVV